MTRGNFESVVFDRYGIKPDYPFNEDFETGVFRHTGTGKWFALAMKIPERRLGKTGDFQTEVVNFKCAPEVIESIVGSEAGIYPAYHMNKTHWLTVSLAECDEGTVSWLLGIAEESRTHKVLKYRFSYLLRRIFLEIPHISLKIRLEYKKIYYSKSVKHLPANKFLMDFGVTSRSKV